MRFLVVLTLVSTISPVYAQVKSKDVMKISLTPPPIKVPVRVTTVGYRIVLCTNVYIIVGPGLPEYVCRVRSR
jgi:hypothetical protein